MFTILPERAEHGPTIDTLLDHSFGSDRSNRTVYRLRENVAPTRAAPERVRLARTEPVGPPAAPAEGTPTP